MKKIRLMAPVLLGSVVLHAGGLEILSLTTSGRLTFTNAFTNGLYTIEWAASPLTNWNETWDQFREFMVTGQVASVEIPIVYRVKCVTNLFLPLPVGSSWLERASNAVGQLWTNRYTIVGSVYLPSKGKEYKLMEIVSPDGIMELVPLRSTEDAVYRLYTFGDECQEFTNAPVGTTWTFAFDMEGEEWVVHARIEAMETITVPAGTFRCIKVKKQRLNTSHPTPYWFEWIAPGEVGLVKWVDYYVDAEEYPPIVYEMVSRTVNTK